MPNFIATRRGRVIVMVVLVVLTFTLIVSNHVAQGLVTPEVSRLTVAGPMFDIGTACARAWAAMATAIAGLYVGAPTGWAWSIAWIAYVAAAYEVQVACAPPPGGTGGGGGGVWGNGGVWN